MAPTNSQGVILVSIQNLLCQACINAGITLPNDSLTQPMVPGASEGILLTSIQNLAFLLANSPTPDGDVLTGTIGLTAGQTDGYTVTFATPFTETPKLTFGTIKGGNGSGNISVSGYAVTATGFTFDTSGDPGTGASLDYFASL